jgi:hypothetical protein
MIKRMSMNKIFGILAIGLLIISCTNKKTENNVVKFSQEIADELKQMAEIDQIAAMGVKKGKYEKLTTEEWHSFKDSVYRTNQKRVKEIFDQYGFVGFDLAGEKGSFNFWLILQHSDHNPEFQQEVLDKMKIEVDKGNADSRNYGYLVDRVKINTGQAQIYGTQVDYYLDICQAFPKNLADSANVNKRRKEIGLNSLEEYLNMMSTFAFESGKENYLKKGIKEPKLYKIE